MRRLTGTVAAAPWPSRRSPCRPRRVAAPPRRRTRAHWTWCGRGSTGSTTTASATPGRPPRAPGVTIAIIDTGIDSGVRELAGAVVGGADFSGFGASNGQKPVGSDGCRARDDGRARSPPVGAPAATRASSGRHRRRRCSRSRSGSAASDDDCDQQIADAVRWAVDNGADVINMSLTRNTLEWPESWDDAFLYAMEHDVVIVAAAGNRGSGTVEVGAPATMPGVLTVSGVDRERQGELRCVVAGHHDRCGRAQRGAGRRHPRRAVRHLERHQRRHPHRRRNRRARAGSASRARRRERHQPGHRLGARCRAGRRRLHLRLRTGGCRGRGRRRHRAW